MAATTSGAGAPVTALIGTLAEPRFAGRGVDPVDVPWGDARKHRQILHTVAGRQVALQLPRGSFLAEGVVLVDDGDDVVAVRRPPEPAVVLAFADNSGPDAVRRALLLGYQLGNQHTPLEITTTELRTPLLTGPETAARALAELGLVGDVREVPLAAHGWSTTSADHHHGHGHGHE
jgi:urease accessory protein